MKGRLSKETKERSARRKHPSKVRVRLQNPCWERFSRIEWSRVEGREVTARLRSKAEFMAN